MKEKRLRPDIQRALNIARRGNHTNHPTRKTEDQKRTTRISIKLTQREAEQIRYHAAQEHKSVSKFIRDIVMRNL